MKSNVQTFNISFPKALVEEIDARATEQFGSRSDFIRAAVLDYMKKQEEWEYIFREGQKIGSQGKFRTEEAALAELAKQRRASGRWFVKADAA